MSSKFDPVKKAEAELDELVAEMKAAASAPDVAGNPVTSAPEPAGTPADVTTQQAAPNPEVNSVDNHVENATYWRNRCEVVLGKYNAEIPRLNADNANLKRQVAELQAARPATMVVAETEGDDYRSPHLDDVIRSSRAYVKMAKEFGTDYAETHFEGAAIAAKQAARAEMQPMQDNIALSATERLHAAISAQSPHWMTTNDDPQFISWAKSTAEPYSGSVIIDLLNGAYSSGDANRVATIFNDYNQMLTSTTTSHVNTGRPNAESLVAPTKRGSSAQTIADSSLGKVWTEVEIDRFYGDHARGRYSNRLKEAKEIEAEISRAYSEGRVR
jgi:hypothetical protein